MVWDSDTATIRFLVVGIAAVVAALTDLRSRRIPNALTIPVLLAGLVWSAAAGGVMGLLESLGSVFLLSLPCFLLFVFASGGAGDVKLLGALGSWLALREAVIVLVCVAAAGVVCGIFAAALQGRLAGLLANLSKILRGFAMVLAARRVRDAELIIPDEKQMQTMPYGVPICLGVWVAAGGHWLWQW